MEPLGAARGLARASYGGLLTSKAHHYNDVVIVINDRYIIVNNYLQECSTRMRQDSQ